MKRIKDLGITLILPIIFLIFWEYMASRLDNKALLPRIEDVMNILMNPRAELVGTGSLLKNTGVSFMRAGISYFLASIIAIPLGLLIGSSRLIEKLLFSFINLFRPIPPLAWSPLVLAWFGITSLATIFNLEPRDPNYSLMNSMRLSMIFIIFTASFFVILVNTIQGVKNLNKEYFDSAKVYGASNYQILTKIILPGSLPSIMTGLRIGLSNAWLALVCAEMLPGSSSGLGYLMTHSYQLTRIDIIVAGIVVIALVNLIIDNLFRFVEKKFLNW